jgi:hypothetical protein
MDNINNLIPDPKDTKHSQEILKESTESIFLGFKVCQAKHVLCKMWKYVADGHADSRSFIGDTTLELVAALYGNNEELFHEEYITWCEHERLKNEEKE